MLTRSWYALLALRMRVSMSAIGSVIVIGLSPLLAAVPGGLRRLVPTCGCGLPARLGHAGQLAPVRHLSQADAAQPERAEHRTGPAAALAAGVGPDAELRLPVRLGDQCLLGHVSSPRLSSRGTGSRAPGGARVPARRSRRW